MTAPASTLAPHRAALAFANLAHFYSHLFMLLYPTVVLALEPVFGLPYGELLTLSMPGFLLFGVGALPAGWLGDRWSANRMMAVFFFGTGAGAVIAGLATGPASLAVGLALTGLFAAIYHPVGTAVVVANAVNRGSALGLNGVFGSAGIASAPLIAGALAGLAGWRAAFIVPGAVCILTGLAFLVVAGGAAGGRRAPASTPAAPVIGRRQGLRALSILMATSLSIGIMATAVTVGLPKVLDVRVTDIAWAGAWAGILGISGLATVALGFGMVGQLVGGALADRLPLRAVYGCTYLAMVPVALISAGLFGLPVVAACALLMMLIATGLPAENSLIARYCPDHWHARAYGLKFVLALGVGALAIPLVGLIYDRSGGFYWLFAVIAGFAALIAVLSLFLPALGDDREAPVTEAAQ